MRVRMMGLTAPLALMMAAGAASAAPNVVPNLAPQLAPHRAVYDLSLADRVPPMTDQATSMQGRMVFEFTGSSCDGYAVNFRFVMEMADPSGPTSVTDLRTTTFEDAAGGSFDFLSQTYTNQILTEEVKGAAESGTDGLKIRLNRPAAADKDFAGTVIFPTAHLAKIITAAKAGQMVLEETVFDGSETGDQIYRTSTMIGAAKTDAPAGNVDRKIGEMPRWPVTVSYFDARAEGDQIPEYSISFDLWENGVSTELVMDYGDIAFNGRLADYEALPAADCPAE